MSDLFITPARILTGVGCFSELGKEAAALAESALVVTGRRAMRKAGVVGRARKLLADADVAARLFEDAPPEPDAASVDRAREACRESGAGVVIGIGGGSAIDVAKAAAGLFNEYAPTAEFLRGREILTPGIPLVAVPTTAGTGTEATTNSVLVDTERRIKKSIRHDSMMPAVALVDPQLTATCPPRVTAYSGMDALTQAIESFVSAHATPVTEPLAIEGVRLVSRSLEIAVANGSDIAARSDCAYGSLITGMAFANSRLGVVHGVAHPLGVRYGIPHGLVCGVLLPVALRLNRPHISDKYPRLCKAVGGDVIDFAADLGRRVGLPQDFSQYNIPRSDFPGIIAHAMASASLKANPKKITEKDVEWLLEEVVGRESRTPGTGGR